MKIVEVGRLGARSSRGQDPGIRVKVRLGIRNRAQARGWARGGSAVGMGGRGRSQGGPVAAGEPRLWQGRRRGPSAGARQGARGRKLT